ncbi:hypothetical protein C3L33_03011, partial [Rhododendron williamsianum]
MVVEDLQSGLELEKRVLRLEGLEEMKMKRKPRNKSDTSLEMLLLWNAKWGVVEWACLYQNDVILEAVQTLLTDSRHSRFLFPALGGLLYGYDIGATSCAIISVECVKQKSHLPHLSFLFFAVSHIKRVYMVYDLSSVDIGLITSGSLYGALIGSLLAFNVADFLGRRRELIVASVLYLVGALVTALAPDFVIMVIGRFVFGIGIGLAMHAAPMYIAETAPSQIRGQLISLKEFFIVLGMVAGYTLGSLLVDTVSGWRYMYGVSTPIAIVMGIGMWWLPASPRWLLLCAIQGKGTMQDLRETAIYCCLCLLQGEVIGDSAPKQVEEMLGELSCVGEEKEAVLAEMFQGKCLKALIIGAGLVLFQQITGQPSVLYYAASILESAGFSAASDTTRVSILLGLLKVRLLNCRKTCIFPSLTSWQFFYRGSLGIPSAIYKLIMTGVAVVVVDRVDRDSSKSNVQMLIPLCVIYASLRLISNFRLFIFPMKICLRDSDCQLSFGPIGWLMISEIFPHRLRGRGLSIAVLVNFGANAVVTFSFSPLKVLKLFNHSNLAVVFPSTYYILVVRECSYFLLLRALLGSGALFFIFGGIAIISLAFIYFRVQSTRDQGAESGGDRGQTPLGIFFTAKPPFRELALISFYAVKWVCDFCLKAMSMGRLTYKNWSIENFSC